MAQRSKRTSSRNYHVPYSLYIHSFPSPSSVPSFGELPIDVPQLLVIRVLINGSMRDQFESELGEY